MDQRGSRPDRFRPGTLGLLGILVAALCYPAGGLLAATPATTEAKGRSASYIVQLVEPPASSYRGGRAGLAATKPQPGQKLDPTRANVRRYAAHLDARQAAVQRAAGVADSAVFYRYRYSFAGFAATLTPAQAARLQRDPGVLRVTQDRMDRLMTDNTPSFLGLDATGGLWSQAGGQARAGEDVIVGVIDTGIWPEHPSFSDQADLADRPGNTGAAKRVYGAPPAYWRGTCQAGELWSKDDCNNKLIGARFFLAGFKHAGIIKEDFESPRDANGHGTHTASTAAGNAGVDPSIFGRDLGVGTISGMAPRARIAAYKACWEDGCILSDLVAAIDFAVADGVDVINYSIGSDTPALLGPDEVSFLFAADANVFVAASAGNAGPGQETVGSPASAPWVTAVGASTHDRFFEGTVRLGNNAAYKGASVTRGLGSRPLVDGEDAGSIGCEAGKLDPAKVTGKIVLCEGSRLRAARGKAVLNAGGVGMVLYAADSPQMQFSDNHYLPAVHLPRVSGLAVKAYIDAAASPTASIIEGGAVADPTAPSMTHFSSRGPNGAAGDIVKPDVTAPGMQVLAANTPVALGSAPGQLFQAISGTSMSSPHVAGVAALLTQAHPDWSPAAMRSAMATTAHQAIVGGYNPFGAGAGQVQPNKMVDPGLVYDAGFADYLAFLKGQNLCCASSASIPALDASDLNQPSLAVGDLAGVQTLTRKVTNVGGSAASYSATVTPPAGFTVSVSPSSFTIAAGATQTFTVTITRTDAPLSTFRFGALTWSDGTHSVRSPITVRPVAIAAPGELTLSGTSGATSYSIKTGYNGSLAYVKRGLIPSQVFSGTVPDDPTDSFNTGDPTANQGITTHDIVVPAGTSRLRISMFDAETDGADDIDLYLYRVNADNSLTLVGTSGGGTSAEQIQLTNPTAATYRLFVHGWQTDGPDANYSLHAWALGTADAGNMTVSGPTTATIGGTGTVNLSWTGLDAGKKYFGAILYTEGATTHATTFVRVDG